ncbi:hypothetical protein P7K49_013780 [Saguinus oedipus]|uniref:Uncharacterized protein n=1 Tax=Saguinus oedipus TaxID=9490 RepID=A0ABQ9VHN7_SAGOE|nr:hypothetical protein P7K49_013780 [Saguinus oedipus]
MGTSVHWRSLQHQEQLEDTRELQTLASHQEAFVGVLGSLCRQFQRRLPLRAINLNLHAGPSWKHLETPEPGLQLTQLRVFGCQVPESRSPAKVVPSGWWRPRKQALSDAKPSYPRMSVLPHALPGGSPQESSVPRVTANKDLTNKGPETACSRHMWTHQ